MRLRDLLLSDYGIAAHRVTIYEDVTQLKDFGVDIYTIKSTQNKYYLASRLFDLPELKLLIDAVESSKFITEKKSRVLSEKLTSLASVNQSSELKRNISITGRIKAGNEQIYYIMDALNAAINKGKKVSFPYVDYRCYKVYPSFYSYFESNLEKLDERTREILTSRYAGETLEAIAQRVGITRERVRQIYKKSNGRFMRTIRLACKADTGSSYFDEDFYEPLYTSAELPDEFWTHEIGLSKPSLDYLNAAYSRGKARPDEILSEEKIPISLRYRVRSFLDCKKVRIDGQLLPPRRAEIEDYAIRKFAQDELLFISRFTMRT